MKRGLVKVVFGLVVLTPCAVVMGEKLHEWETATLISQELTSDSNTVVVDTGKGDRYVWQEQRGGPDWHHFIVLTGPYQAVHGQVKFYHDGQWLVVLDKQGEKHKFIVVRAMKFE